MTATEFLEHIGASNKEKEMIKARDLFGFGKGLRVVGSFGDCPRCPAVCPVGNDYHAYLRQSLKRLSRKHRKRYPSSSKLREARKNGDEIDGLNDWNIRWV